MANNFRGTQRQLYNPSTAKYLSGRELRSEYAALRRIANKRASRLTESGYGDSELARRNFPAGRSLSDEEVRQALLDVSVFLRDPRTTRPGYRAYAESMQEALKRSGLEKAAARDPVKFGRFMGEMRTRAGGRLAGSGSVAQAYDEAVSRGMRPETLRKHFSNYLTNEREAEKLAATLYNAPSEGRLTIAKLTDLLG